MAVRVRTFGLALIVVTVLIAIFVTQWPFDYRLTNFAIHRRWDRIDWSWLPRTHLGHIRIDRDFALNLLMLVPLGVGYGLWRHARRLRVVVESLLVGIVTSGVLEIAQLLTPYRYTSFADLWRNAFGCMAACLVTVIAVRSRRGQS